MYYHVLKCCNFFPKPSFYKGETALYNILHILTVLPFYSCIIFIIADTQLVVSFWQCCFKNLLSLLTNMYLPATYYMPN